MNTVLTEHPLPGRHTLQIVQGDITSEAVDAIVNAANEQLQHGGGMAWAIAKKGGPVIQQESDAWVRQHGLVPHTQPAWTSGGLLPAKYVIHAVGPVWGDGDEDKKLADAVTGSLRVADELKCASVALPAISTGIFGFPKERAAGIILAAVEEYFAAHTASTMRVVKLVIYDQATLQAVQKTWQDKWSQ